jgi:hypothetical protein
MTDRTTPLVLAITGLSGATTRTVVARSRALDTCRRGGA